MMADTARGPPVSGIPETPKRVRGVESPLGKVELQHLITLLEWVLLSSPSPGERVLRAAEILGYVFTVRRHRMRSRAC